MKKIMIIPLFLLAACGGGGQQGGGGTAVAAASAPTPVPVNTVIHTYLFKVQNTVDLHFTMQIEAHTNGTTVITNCPAPGYICHKAQFVPSTFTVTGTSLDAYFNLQELDGRILEIELDRDGIPIQSQSISGGTQMVFHDDGN